MKPNYIKFEPEKYLIKKPTIMAAMVMEFGLMCGWKYLDLHQLMDNYFNFKPEEIQRGINSDD